MASCATNKKNIVLETADPAGIILPRKRHKQAFIKVESQLRNKRKRERVLKTVLFGSTILVLLIMLDVLSHV